MRDANSNLLDQIGILTRNGLLDTTGYIQRSRDQGTDKRSERVGWILAGAVVVIGALLQSVGGLTTLSPLSSQAGAYLGDHNLGLAVLLLVLLALRWTQSLAVVLFGTAVIHLVDALADAHFQLLPAASSSLVVAVVSAAAAVWLFRQPARWGQVARQATKLSGLCGGPLCPPRHFGSVPAQTR